MIVAPTEGSSKNRFGVGVGHFLTKLTYPSVGVYLALLDFVSFPKFGLREVVGKLGRVGVTHCSLRMVWCVCVLGVGC